MRNVFLAVVVIALVVSCNQLESSNKKEEISILSQPNHVKNQTLVNEQGTLISERVLVPEGFIRVPYPKQSFQNYLRNYKLKPFGSKIINYDATEYYWQEGHIGVLDISVPKNGCNSVQMH